MGNGQSNQKPWERIAFFHRLVDVDRTGSITAENVREWLEDELFVGNTAVVDYETYSTKDEALEAALQSFFAKFDQNNDGKISRSEIESVLRSLSKDEISNLGKSFLYAGSEEHKELIQTVFNVLDKDKNGILSYKEVMDWIRHEKAWMAKNNRFSKRGKKHRRSLTQIDAKKVFQSLDSNNDGEIDFSEFFKLTQSWSIRDLRRRTSDAFYLNSISNRSIARQCTGVGFEAEAETCMACMEAIPPNSFFLQCGMSGFHHQCLLCFAHFVQVSCSSYLQDDIPLRCPVSGCHHPITERCIQELLLKIPDGMEIWNEYMAASVRVGLMDDKNMCAVTCQACNKYSELYPKNYQEVLKKVVRTRNRLLDDDDIDIPTRAEVKMSIAEEKVQHKQDNNPLLTTEIFTCRLPECRKKTCLLCWTQYDPMSSTAEHNCSVNQIKACYDTVVDILAAATSKKCPTCGFAGVKDLRCTHMACKCGTRWCYHCGKKMISFSKHNSKFRLEHLVDAKQDLCPGYLRYAYSLDNYHHEQGRFGGTAANALEFYHVHTQREALRVYVKSLNEEDTAVFKKMVKTKFPDGIWSTMQIKRVDYIFYTANRLAKKMYAYVPRMFTPAVSYHETAAGKTVIHVSWLKPLCSPPATSYTLGYRSWGDPKFTNVNQGRPIFPGHYVLGYTEPLQRNTRYQVNVSGCNKNGHGAWSYSRWIKTSPVTYDLQRPRLSYNAATGNFLVKWCRPVSDPPVICFSLGMRCLDDGEVKFRNCNGQQVILKTEYVIGHFATELVTPGKTYQCNLSAYTKQGWSKWVQSIPVRAKRGGNPKNDHILRPS